MAKLGVFAREHDVAMTGQLGRTRQAIAVDLGDHWFWQRPQTLPPIHHFLQTDAIAGDGKAGTRLLRGLQVVTGAERAPRPTNYQHTRGRVAFEFVERAVEFTQEFLRH